MKRVIMVVSICLSWTTEANGDTCYVDVMESTDSDHSTYDFFFGRIIGAATETEAFALCVGERSDADGDTRASSQTTRLVAYTETGRAGSCGTSDYSYTCDSQGCDLLEAVVADLSTVVLGPPEGVMACRDEHGLLGDDVLIEPHDGHVSARIVDSLDDGSVSLEGGILATCTVGSSLTVVNYGRGYYWAGGYYRYDGEMYVCAMDPNLNFYRVCTFPSSTMRSTGLVQVIENNNTNPTSIPSFFVSCNGLAYRVYGWDANWLKGMLIYGEGDSDGIYGSPNNDYLYGGDGADHLVGMGGADVLRGYGGNDQLIGGYDAFTADGHVDQLYGMDDLDLMYGAHEDNCWGGLGADECDGPGDCCVYCVDDPDSCEEFE